MVLRGTLGDIAAQVLAVGVRSTAVIIVGKVLAASGHRRRDQPRTSSCRGRSVTRVRRPVGLRLDAVDRGPGACARDRTPALPTTHGPPPVQVAKQ